MFAWEVLKKLDDGPVPISRAASSQRAIFGPFLSFERLRKWISDDSPVADQADDVFGHHRIALRIASRLVCVDPPAQAVIGRLGAGKTTLRNLVTRSLESMESGSRVRIVPVELWPYETPRAAVEGTIRTLVEALSQEVSVLGLKGLPESYSEAMNALGGIWSALARLKGTPSNPFDVLKRIDEIATAIGYCFVVWVEDLERYAVGGSGQLDDSMSATETQRLNPIRALLFGLDQLRSVTVVTATTTLNLRFDLDKIARFIEEIPDLPAFDASRIIRIFREGCRSRADVIDPAPPEARKEFDSFIDKPEQYERLRSMLDMDTDVYGASQALTVLCRTPRALKQGLRGCLDVWDKLAGEIDFDDLLVMSVLRETEPRVFALIRQHVNALRTQNSRTEGDPRAVWRASLDKLQLDGLTKEAVNEIVKFVFQDSEKPQGFAQHGHVDYWKRFLSVPKLEEKELDQSVLHTMLADDDIKLLELLEDDEQHNAVEDFAHIQTTNKTDILTTDRLVGLFLPMVERRANESQRYWGDSTPPALIPLWRMWMRRSERNLLKADRVLQQVQAAFDIALPKNLGLVTEIEHYFVTSDKGVHNMLANGEVSHNETAKKYLRELLVSTYTGKPHELVDALRNTKSATLLWLCWGLDRLRAKETTGVPFDGWDAFAKTILEATWLNPIVMIPQLACLIVRESRLASGDFGLVSEFDEAAAQQLFGDSKVILDFLRTQDISSWATDRHVEAVIRAAQSGINPS